MRLSFIKVNPTENMTVFILDPVPRERHMEIAEKIMNYNSLHAEQVGYLEHPKDSGAGVCVRLQMMGGEFCGNATLSLAAAVAHKDFPGVTESEGVRLVTLEVSGSTAPISCTVKQTGTDAYSVQGNMPLPRAVEPISVPYSGRMVSGHLVEFDGISHAVLLGCGSRPEPGLFDALQGLLAPRNYDALGLMCYDEALEYMEPLVYVRDTDSLIWERGCGSGTMAVGVVLSCLKRQSVSQTVRQPGGELTVAAAWNRGRIGSLTLQGIMRIVAEGEVYLRS